MVAGNPEKYMRLPMRRGLAAGLCAALALLAPVASGQAVGVPGSVAATKGTLTDSVRVTWAAVVGAASYNVYRAGTKVNTAPVIGLTFDDANTTVTTVAYTVRSVSTSANESANSVASSGYPNLAPTFSSAALAATYLAASTGVTPTVTDPNVTAGQAETYVYTLLTQPAAGQGSASIVANKLVWTPPVTPRFGGVTTFTYRVADKGGATVIGTATVSVAGADLAVFTSFTAPTTLYVGQSATATAVVNNSGTTTWTSSGNGIGTDWTSTTSTVGAFRVPLSDVSVPPGGSTTVSLPFTAPLTAGTYTVNAMTYKTGPVWFGTKSANVIIVVAGPPPVPAGVAVTQGTLTGATTVTWTANTGTTTASYNVYRATQVAYTAGSPVWTLVGSSNFGTNALTDTFPSTAAIYVYALTSVNPSGESDKGAPATGYANVAPEATSEEFAAAADTASPGITPSVTDANAMAGQAESFSFAIVTQPAAGQGSASVVTNKLVWTPPLAHDFAGSTTFTYSVTDKGASIATGIATVNVAPVTTGIPTTVVASKGTLTNAVRVTWTAVAGALSYNVYLAGAKVNASPVTALSFDDPNGSVASVGYTVRSVSPTGMESSDSLVAYGYPNNAPTATSTVIFATATMPGTATPTVTDPNATAGQTEVYTVTILTQPPVGKGTASVAANRLVYTPPVSADFAGATTFTYSVSDKGGASVSGTAAVNVTPVAGLAATGVVATDGTLTDKVRISWNAPLGAVSYVISSAPSVTGSKTVIATGVLGTSFDYAIASLTPQYYSVQSVSASGGLSPHSNADSGYPNLAPVMTSATLGATATTASAAVTPTVSDPNMTNSFTFVLASQPPSGEGTASIVGNKLMWTPPNDFSFFGTTTFTYLAIDSAGANDIGIATVIVTPVVVGPPTGVTATQGTLTDLVRLAWTGIPGAASYNVYRDGVKVNTSPIIAHTFDDVNTNATAAGYTMRSMSGPGVESDAGAVTYGFPNKLPTATSATLNATALTSSPGVTPSVTDANSGDAFLFAVVTQPAAGQGAASVVANKLVWTPPGDNSFSGNTSFTYSVTDRAGGTITGTAAVNVVAFIPAVPNTVTATQGSVTDAVQVTWVASPSASGYNIYSAGMLVGSAAGSSVSADIPVTSVEPAAYVVRSFSAAGAESASSIGATGWPNLAPTATSVTLTATATTVSPAVTPAVTDLNHDETFRFAVVGQPAAGQGTASVIGNKLMWTPPVDFSFAGVTTFTYAVTDKIGASLQGVATVNVALFVPVAPATVQATPGTLTGHVQVTWPPVADAVSYRVYKAGVLLTPATSPFDEAVTEIAYGRYTVRAVAAAGGESLDSNIAIGWPNAPPASASVSGFVAANAVAQPLTIVVVDPNTAAGQQEAFTFTPTLGTTANGGSFTFANGQLLYTASSSGTSGTDTLSFTVTDRGGSSVNGSGNINVCTPPSVGGGVATITGVTAGVVGDACNGIIAATGVVQYRTDSGVNWTNVGSFAQPVATSGISGHYTVSRAVNAKAGLYQTVVTLTDASGQFGQATFPFTVDCPVPSTTLTGASGTVEDPVFAAAGIYTSADVCGAPLTASLQVFAAADIAGITPLATGQLAGGLPAGQTNALAWQFPALQPASYRVVQTVANNDGQAATATASFSVACPPPSIFTLGISQESGLEAASGLIGLWSCNLPLSTLVTVDRSGNLTTLPVSLYDTVGGYTYYRFDYPVADLVNGNYALNIAVVDGVGRSSSKSTTLAVNRGSPTVQLTIGGIIRPAGGAIAESLGHFGVKTSADGLPNATKQ